MTGNLPGIRLHENTPLICRRERTPGGLRGYFGFGNNADPVKAHGRDNRGNSGCLTGVPSFSSIVSPVTCTFTSFFSISCFSLPPYTKLSGGKCLIFIGTKGQFIEAALKPAPGKWIPVKVNIFKGRAHTARPQNMCKGYTQRSPGFLHFISHAESIRQ